MTSVEPKLQNVKKFYFLEYFYVLLASVKRFSDKERIFDSFKDLKQRHRLGESKYKKLSIESEGLSEKALGRYRYTFEQVISEAHDYGLVSIDEDAIHLTEEGKKVLELYETGNNRDFNLALFNFMEKKHHAFRYLVDFCHKANTQGGVLIFPNYSPRRLECKIGTMRHVADYCTALVCKLQTDTKDYLRQELTLSEANNDLLSKLEKSQLWQRNDDCDFDSKNFNKVAKRIRDHWNSYFLKTVYGYPDSWSSFDIWTYRAKQAGILHVTEFYPSFHGRIVYPTAVVSGASSCPDFESVFDYSDGCHLYVHRPSWQRLQETFIGSLQQAYLDLRKSYRNYFIPLAALRERVCFKLKISEAVFGEFLDKAYRLNLEHKLGIMISLEVDKLPEETNLAYLKRDPVMVGGQYRNIIAIDNIARGGTS